MPEPVVLSQPRQSLHRPQLAAFLSLGFRPLYMAGCLWAAVSIAIWIFVPQALHGSMTGLYWHAHEMLWGFIATIAVGFLFTASANWTGINPLHGKGLAILVLLWLVARLGFMVPGSTAFTAAAVSELLFFAVAVIALARVIYRASSLRNFGVPVLVFGLGVSDGLFLWGVRTGNYSLLIQRFDLGLLCMAVIALLIARRVIPFFAMRAIPNLNIPMHTRSGQFQLVAAVLAIAFLVSGWRLGQTMVLAIAGLIALWQVLAWKPWVVWRVPLLWILYIGYAALGLGLLVAAAYAQGMVMHAAWPVHVIGVAGFSVLIIGMVTRTALGHLGRPLRTAGSMLTAFVLVMLAAVLRLLALLPIAQAQLALHAAAVAWILAFVLYLWRFAPLLIRPRGDAV